MLDIRWVRQSSENNENLQVLPLLDSVYLPLHLPNVPLQTFGYDLLRVRVGLNTSKGFRHRLETRNSLMPPLILLSVFNARKIYFVMTIFLKFRYEFLAFTSVSDIHVPNRTTLATLELCIDVHAWSTRTKICLVPKWAPNYIYIAVLLRRTILPLPSYHHARAYNSADLHHCPYR